MEKVIRIEFVEYLVNFSLLSADQHRFRKGKSCLSQLLEYLEDVHNVLDVGGFIDTIYLDIQKAFDTVPHGRILLKMKNLGVVGKIHSWVENYSVMGCLVGLR